MIVDDSRTMRVHISGILKSHGYVVLEADDGLDGLAVLRVNRDVATIIADINMPRMDGIEMLAAINNDPSLSNCPIIMLTTETNTELITKVRSLGARGWIVKPVDEQQLIMLVRNQTR